MNKKKSRFGQRNDAISDIARVTVIVEFGVWVGTGVYVAGTHNVECGLYCKFSRYPRKRP